MKLICDQCQAEYHIGGETAGPGDALVRCTKCQHLIAVRAPGKVGSAPAGAPQAGARTEPAGSRLPLVDDADVISLLAPERDRADQARERRAKAQRSSGFSAAEAEWFIAVDDRPVGPVALEEILARFKKGEVVATTLCWKAGMVDWTPASEVPKLAARLGLGSEPASGPAGAVAMGAQAPLPPPIEKPAATGFRPSSALDSLVRAELDALDTLATVQAPIAAEREERSPVPPRLALVPPVQAEAEEVRSAPSPAPAPLPPLRAAPAVPTALYVSVGLLALMAVGALIVATVVLVRSPAAVPPSSEIASAPVAAPAPAPPAAPEQAAAAKATPPAPATPAPSAAPPEEPTAKKATTAEPATPATEEVAPPPPPRAKIAAQAPQKPPIAPRARAPKPRREREVAARQPAPEPKSETASANTSPGETPRTGETPSTPAPAPRGEAVDRAFDEMFGEGSSTPGPAAKPAPEAKPAAPPASQTRPATPAIPPAPGWGTKSKLSQSDILDVVTRHSDRIRACTDAVRVPGRAQTVVLRWTIRPDGTASAPTVVTKEFRDTELARCLAGALGSLRFPAYSGPAMEPVELPVRF